MGPGAVFTNDRHPRAVNPDGSRKTELDWERQATTVGMGASIGARAICVAPVQIGPWAMVAAGAVVATNVPAFSLVAGVPARLVGWVSSLGHRLTDPGRGWLECPVSGERFELDEKARTISRLDG